MKQFPFKSPFRNPEIPDFAEATFRRYHLESDRIMLLLLLMHWGIATFLTSLAYDTHLYGFAEGGLIVLVYTLAYRFDAGHQTVRAIAAISMMLFSLIFIQQHLGRIEMHFHVFIGMAMLTLYKDELPIYVAAFTTVVHHLVFNYLQLYEVSMFGLPVMIFNYGCGLDIVILHAIFVLAEAVVLGYIVRLQIEHAVELNRSEQAVRELNRELSYTSLHDLLTDLPNRQNLYSRMEHITADANRRHSGFAVMFLDLDHFKTSTTPWGMTSATSCFKASHRGSNKPCGRTISSPVSAVTSSSSSSPISPNGTPCAPRSRRSWGFSGVSGSSSATRCASPPASGSPSTPTTPPIFIRS